MKAREEPKSDWNDGFLFLGNQLTLDFLNTRPVLDGEPVDLLPDLQAVLRWFYAAGLISSRQRTTLLDRWSGLESGRRTVEALQEWREKLRKEVTAWEQGYPVHRNMVNELNRLLADHPMSSRLKAEGARTSLEFCLRPQHPEDLIAPLAHSAAKLFAETARSRVRQCGNCMLHFLDTSKKGTRRWCSMQLCGNRLKVAAYAARRRSRKKVVV